MQAFEKSTGEKTSLLGRCNLHASFDSRAPFPASRLNGEWVSMLGYATQSRPVADAR